MSVCGSECSSLHSPECHDYCQHGQLWLTVRTYWILILIESWIIEQPFWLYHLYISNDSSWLWMMNCGRYYVWVMVERSMKGRGLRIRYASLEANSVPSWYESCLVTIPTPRSISRRYAHATFYSPTPVQSVRMRHCLHIVCQYVR
jgi:hypothetical protein